MFYDSLGSLLYEMRDKKGFSLREVAKDCKISEAYIAKIEKGDLYQLPSYVHALNFTKKYSEYIGFDFDLDIKHLFEKECVKEYFEQKVLDPNFKVERYGVVVDKEIDKTMSKIRTANQKSKDIKGSKIQDNINKSSSSQENKKKQKNKLWSIIFYTILLIAILAGVLYYQIMKSQSIDNEQEIATPKVEKQVTLGLNTATENIKKNLSLTNGEKTTNSLVILNLLNYQIVANDFGEFSFAVDSSLKYYLKIQQNESFTDTDAVINFENYQDTYQNIKNYVYMDFTDIAWVSIKSDTGYNISGEFSAGDRLEIDFQDSFSADLGNIIGLTMTYNKQLVPLIEGRVTMIGYTFKVDPYTKKLVFSKNTRVASINTVREVNTINNLSNSLSN